MQPLWVRVLTLKQGLHPENLGNVSLIPKMWGKKPSAWRHSPEYVGSVAGRVSREPGGGGVGAGDLYQKIMVLGKDQ